MTVKKNKRIWKWIKRSIIVMSALVVLLSSLLSFDFIQTGLGHYATIKLNERFGTDFNIGKLTFNFGGQIVFKDILIKDHNQNELIAVNQLETSILSFSSAVRNNLHFGAIDLDGLNFNMITYLGEEESNLDQFVNKLAVSPRSDKSKSTFMMTAETINIENSFYVIKDENKNSQIDFDELFLTTSDFLIEGPNVSMIIDQLRFVNQKGFRVKNFSSGFSYTLTYMIFKDINLTTETSEVNGQLRFDYKREDLKDFNNKVKASANFENMSLSSEDLRLFYDGFGKDLFIEGNSKFQGSLNDLSAKDVDFTFSNSGQLKGDFQLNDLFTADRPYQIFGKIGQFEGNQNMISLWLPNVLSPELEKYIKRAGTIQTSGDISVSAYEIDLDLSLTTFLGSLNSDISIFPQEEHISGTLSLSRFDMGSLLNVEKIGKVSGFSSFDTNGFDSASFTANIAGELDRIDLNSYVYAKTSFSGKATPKAYTGQVKFRDPNLNANFDGLILYNGGQNQYKFAAHVLQSNLKALNIVNNDKESVFSGHMLVDTEGKNVDDALGIVSFYDISYRNQDGNYVFQNFDITAAQEEDFRILKVNSPEIISGQIKGLFKLSELNKLASNALGHIYDIGDEYVVTPNQSLDFDFVVYNKIAKVISEYLNIGEDGTLRGHLESDSQKFKVNLYASLISSKGFSADHISLELDNDNPLYNTFAEIGQLRTPYFNAKDLSLINVTRRDTLFVKTQFKGDGAASDRYDVNLYYTKGEQNKSILGFRRSNIVYQNIPWIINPNRDNNHKIEFDNTFNNLQVYPITLVHDEELIRMSGEVFSTDEKSFDIDFYQVNLEHVLPKIDKFEMSGIVNGKLSLFQKDGTLSPVADISVANYMLNGFGVGAFETQITGLSAKEYAVKAILADDFLETMTIDGTINFDNTAQNLNLELQLNEALLDPLTPLGGEIISNIRGDVSGMVFVSGGFDAPQFDGDLVLKNAGMTVPYLNIDYSFQGNTMLKLQEQSFGISNLELVDTVFETRAEMNGFVRHSNFKNWILDLDISSDRMLVLNTNNDKKPLYYGSAFVAGDVGIKGPAEALIIKAEVLTKKGTTFIIPLNDTQILSSSNYLSFLSPDEKFNTDATSRVISETYSGLELDFDLEIDETADIEIVLDAQTKSGIRGYGNGGLLVQINTNGKFNMYGDFIVKEGVYNYIYEPIIRKEFKVNPGGTIVWDGEPTKAAINVTAVYSQLQANPSILLDNPINRSIPVAVEIQLSGQLERPEPTFDLRFPNVNSALNSELGYRLNDNESKQFQALSLLATGAFTNQLRLDEQAVYGNLVERVAAVVNSALSGGDDVIQLGLDYQMGRKTQDYITENRVGVSLSGKISDRVLFNGKVGVPFGGVNETVVAGNFEIQVLLNEERTLTLNIFNKENDIQNFGEAIFFTQGVGLSYDVEFDNLKELLQKIFDSKQSKKNTKEEINKKTSTGPLEGFMTFEKDQ